MRPQILMGLLSEKTGQTRITPLLYGDGFSRDWTLGCQSSLFVDFVFVSRFSWTMAALIPICFLDFLDLGKDIFYVALSRHCGITFQQLSRAAPEDQRKLADLSCFPSILSELKVIKQKHIYRR